MYGYVHMCAGIFLKINLSAGAMMKEDESLRQLSLCMLAFEVKMILVKND